MGGRGVEDNCEWQSAKEKGVGDNNGAGMWRKKIDDDHGPRPTVQPMLYSGIHGSIETTPKVCVRVLIYIFSCGWEESFFRSVRVTISWQKLNNILGMRVLI